MSQVESFVLKGVIDYPYKWAVGNAAARFFSELKNSTRVVGLKCDKCGKVMVPPADVCGACFTEPSEWVEVGPAGTVQTFTVVEKKLFWSPVDPPYAIVAVRFDGADTDFFLIMKEPDKEKLKIGARVEPVWKELRTGDVLDIDTLKLSDAPAGAAKPIAEFTAKPIPEKKGNLLMPYEWSYGESLTKFFTATRDEKKIYGARCTKCGKVLVPPVGLCGKCFAPTEKEWVPISDHGWLVSWTVVYLPFPGQPTEPPYCYGMIKFDGVNTQFPHIVKGAKKGNWDDLEVGMRVEAVWNENRKGDLYDISHFKREGS